MLLDCAKLRHWRFAEDLKALWAHKIDYLDWINLKREKPQTRSACSSPSGTISIA